MADFLQNPPKLMPKLDRVLPQIDIPPAINKFLPSDKSSKKTVLIIAGAIVVIVLIILFAVLFLKSQPEVTPPVKPSPTPFQTPKPISTPTPYIPPSITPTPFVANICGNGVIDDKESCDGTNFAGKTCASEVGTNYEGILSCTQSCKIDTTGCKIKRIISIKDSAPLPPLTQTSGASPAQNAVKVTDSVKFSNSVRTT